MVICPFLPFFFPSAAFFRGVL